MRSSEVEKLRKSRDAGYRMKIFSRRGAETQGFNFSQWRES
jgi:hypothetical protein